MADTPTTPAASGSKSTTGAKKVSELEAALAAKTEELGAQTAQIESLTGRVATLSTQKEGAEKVALRNLALAIVAGVAAGVMTLFFFLANSDKKQESHRASLLSEQLVACQNKQPTAPPVSPPATSAPATGNACVTQETHVTVNGSKPFSPPLVKVESKQKQGVTVPVAPPASAPGAPQAPAVPTADIPPHGCMYTSDGTAILKGQTAALAKGTVIAQSTFADINASTDKAVTAIRSQFPNWKTDLPQRMQMCAKWSDHQADLLQKPKGRTLGETTLIK